jgi:phosphatidylserine/phosphatidylglycerophosphate/cardiolipin synthase-like enzyme
VSINAVVEAVRNAKSSVLFCLFTPTDAALRSAIFEIGDVGKMMFGLVNSIGSEEPDEDSERADAVARVEIYHRSQKNRDVFAHSLFPQGNEPVGFWWESSRLGSVDQSRFPVYIHHKFIVIDGETDRPTIYTGSANMSKNSIENNDENLLEIKGSPRLAAVYLAEFLRLYEHYRARAQWQRWEENRPNTFKLRPDSSWVKGAYRRGSPEFKSRINMVK